MIDIVVEVKDEDQIDMSNDKRDFDMELTTWLWGDP